VPEGKAPVALGGLARLGDFDCFFAISSCVPSCFCGCVCAYVKVEACLGARACEDARARAGGVIAERNKSAVCTGRGTSLLFSAWGGAHSVVLVNAALQSPLYPSSKPRPGPMASKGPSDAYKMVSVEEAVNTVLAEIAKLGGRLPPDPTPTPLGPALLGRVLAEDVVAAAPLPPFPASIKVDNERVRE